MAETVKEKPNPYQASIDSTIEQRNGQTAIVVTDAHNRSDMVYKFAGGLAKDLNYPVAVEVLPVSAQPLIDALAAGEITREQFASSVGGGNGSSQLRTASYFMGYDRADQFNEDLKDLIQSGRPVYAIGTTAGNDKLSNDPELRRLMEKIQTLESQNKVELMKFTRANEKSLEDDPKSLFWKEMQEGLENPDLDQDKLRETIQAMRDKEAAGPVDPEDYKAEILGHVATKSPAFKEMIAVMDDGKFAERLEALGIKSEEDLDPKKLKGGDFNANRYVADPDVADRMAAIVQKHGGVVGVYGLNHTLHEQDLDKSLRDKGIPTMIVDAGLPKPGNKPCLDLPSDFRCQGNPQIFTEALDRIIQHKDPNRFQVDLAVPGDKATPVQGSEISKPVVKPTAPVPG